MTSSSQSPSSVLPAIQILGMSSSTSRQSAMDTMNNNADLLNNLNQVGGIFRLMKSKKMKGGQIVVPMPTTMFQQTMGGDQSVTNVVTNGAITMTSSAENSKYDGLVGAPEPVPANQLKGGYKTKKMRKSRKSGKRKGKSKTSMKRKGKGKSKKSRK